jgi:predicted ferric reductase
MGFVLELIVGFIWWIVLFLAVWVLATPFILFGAAFSSRPYLESVSSMFGK